ncbi:MAG: pseudaminic acid synthase, partial [Epsilonproteobacteria bacterium]|nr:pseudaminic acid synthase [Campylobacterota bacterium]
MKIGSYDLTKDGTYIIAEMSANHNGSLENALQTIKVAKEIGANAIKLQTYTAD